MLQIEVTKEKPSLIILLTFDFNKYMANIA